MNTSAAILALRAFAALPMLTLAGLSLAKSQPWEWWASFMRSLIPEEPPEGLLASITHFQLVFLGSWLSLALAFALLLVFALASRARTGIAIVGTVCILAQLPGLVSHTRFYWPWLMAGTTPEGQPNMAIVAIALLVTPVGIYGLGMATALEKLEGALGRAGVDERDVRDACVSNYVLLVSVLATSMVVGIVATLLAIRLPGWFAQRLPLVYSMARLD